MGMLGLIAMSLNTSIMESLSVLSLDPGAAATAPDPSSTLLAHDGMLSWRVHTTQQQPKWQRTLAIKADKLSLATFTNANSPGFLRGSLVTQLLKRGEPMITLPYAAVLTRANSKCMPVKVTCTGWDSLILTVMCERASSESPWREYLTAVHTQKHSQLTDWPLEALRELVPSLPPQSTQSETRPLVLDRLGSVGFNWRGLTGPQERAKKGWEELEQRLPEQHFPASVYNESSYCSAWRIVQTRVFALRQSNASNVLGLVPYLDFLNHQVPRVDPLKPATNIIPFPTIVNDSFLTMLASDDYQATHTHSLCLNIHRNAFVGIR